MPSPPRLHHVLHLLPSLRFLILFVFLHLSFASTRSLSPHYPFPLAQATCSIFLSFFHLHFFFFPHPFFPVYKLSFPPSHPSHAPFALPFPYTSSPSPLDAPSSCIQPFYSFFHSFIPLTSCIQPVPPSICLFLVSFISLFISSFPLSLLHSLLSYVLSPLLFAPSFTSSFTLTLSAFLSTHTLLHRFLHSFNTLFFLHLLLCSSIQLFYSLSFPLLLSYILSPRPYPSFNHATSFLRYFTNPSHSFTPSFTAVSSFHILILSFTPTHLSSTPVPTSYSFLHILILSFTPPALLLSCTFPSQQYPFSHILILL